MIAQTTISHSEIEVAANRLKGIAHRTPVLSSRLVNERTGATVHFKAENLQRTGSFKFRGAYFALSRLSSREKKSGVLCWSSGNHAQAIALAGKLLDIPRTIVMPSDAPAVKLAATRDYGAEVVIYDRAKTTREQVGRKIAEERGLVIIPPFDHPHIIAGQGTTAHELLEEVGPLDYLFVCVGGGGLISGCSCLAKHFYPECQVVGVEPAAGDDATRSFRTGRLHTVRDPQTIADGARTASLGALTFPMVCQHVDDMMTVSDEELVTTMKYLWERLKVVIEPTGALAAAGLFNGRHDVTGKRVGVVISGGNVDLDALPALFAVQGEGVR